jgi:hypothetical protein
VFVRCKDDKTEKDTGEGKSVKYYDAHVWIQDEHGNIYDIFDVEALQKEDPELYRWCAHPTRKNRFFVLQDSKTTGVLVYLPAPKSIQEQLMIDIGKRSLSLQYDLVF